MPSIIKGKAKSVNESPQLEERYNFNSTTKSQSFFGCNDIDELKSNTTIEKVSNKKSHILKNIFTNKKRRKGAKRIRKKLHKTSLSAPNISSMTNTEKILWRPSLKIVYNDPLLLKTLITFMEKSYNSENILFLLSVKKLQQTLQDIDTLFNITCIYNTYIIRNAPHQINLSYHCFVNILSKKDTFNTFDIDTKHSMFDECVREIEQLMVTSILPSFYNSNMFQSVAKQSKCYESYLLRDKVYSYNGTKDSKSGSETEENSCDMDGFIAPVLVRNRRPCLSCALLLSTTELLNEVKLN